VDLEGLPEDEVDEAIVPEVRDGEVVMFTLGDAGQVPCVRFWSQIWTADEVRVAMSRRPSPFRSPIAMWVPEVGTTANRVPKLPKSW